MLVDTHCHINMLDFDTFKDGIDGVIQDAHDHQVSRMICISVDFETLPDVLSIADQHESVFATVGVHPSESHQESLTVERLVELADRPKVVAFGETGLDYHYNDTGLEHMRDQFRIHIQAAHELHKPVVIHTRAAQKDTLAIMQEERARDVGGVMHCFTESLEMAKQALDMGFYISLSGIVTFKNAKNVQEVAAYVPLDRLLIETDAPYLTPVPYRGKPNQPSYVRFVAQKLADIKQVPLEVVATQTTDNAMRLFALD